MRRCTPTTIVLGFALIAVRAWGQDSSGATATPATLTAQPPAQTAPSINFRVRPAYATDPQRLRRTPQIDGVLADGEWDPFYTVTDGPIKGTIFCNWDDNYLYIATRTDQPAGILVDIDATDDGWLRGADNLEVVVGSAGENSPPTLTARLLDAANSKDTPVWSTQSLDLKSILLAGKVVNGTQVIELAIPKNMGSLVLRPGANLGLRAEFLPAGPASAYVPTAPYEPHLLLDMTLVESRALAAAGINPHLSLSDLKCVAGEKLFATLELRNQTDIPVSIRTLSWGGTGASASVVDSIRQVATPPIPANGRLKLGYKTVLPESVSPGSYTLVVTAELTDGRQVQSTASFSVVEPIQPQISSDPDPVTVVGNTKLDVRVSIYSALQDHFRGELEVTKYPNGWVLEGNRRRSVAVYGEDHTGTEHVLFKLPSSTPAGDYPVEMRIVWRNRTWDLHRVIHVQTTVAAPAGTARP
jgi:hypothetical protein